jgi:hypothetical protein
VAGCANFAARKIRGRGFLGLHGGLLIAGRRSAPCPGAQYSCAQQSNPTHSQPQLLPWSRTKRQLR